MENETFEKLFSERFPFWKELDASEKEAMLSASEQRRYPAGARLQDELRECAGMILIRSGSLRVYMISDEGREITLYRLYPDDVCVLSAACVLDSITFTVQIDAEEDADVIVTASRAVRRLSDGNVFVRCFANETAVKRFSDVMWSMQQLLFLKADRRLARFLTEESRKTEGPVRMTHEQIARQIGSAREVVSRLLKDFEQEGMVRLGRKSVEILDPLRLTETAEESAPVRKQK